MHFPFKNYVELWEYCRKTYCRHGCIYYSICLVNDENAGTHGGETRFNHLVKALRKQKLKKLLS